jgi:hypothetical protein
VVLQRQRHGLEEALWQMKAHRSHEIHYRELEYE